jgi:hypothetical protein
MKAEDFFEILVPTYEVGRRHIPEDCGLLLEYFFLNILHSLCGSIFAAQIAVHELLYVITDIMNGKFNDR